jgi:2-amino-4-hydroxy-6-hydroxymethyldihydropteridine diphosphokinase
MRAYIALGSNLGDSVANIKRALTELENFSASPIRKSSLWRSMPVDCPEGSPDFINAAVALSPLEGETPESLLVKLQALEVQFGRQPKAIPNEPRPLDLDLLAFGDERCGVQNLTLPHPRFHQRSFVLEPMNQIAPDLTLPGQTLSVNQLLNDLDTDESLSRL